MLVFWNKVAVYEYVVLLHVYVCVVFSLYDFYLNMCAKMKQTLGSDSHDNTKLCKGLIHVLIG